jgi:hypothetical protein
MNTSNCITSISQDHMTIIRWPETILSIQHYSFTNPNT